MTQVVEELIDSLPNPELKSTYKGEASDSLFRWGKVTINLNAEYH